MGQVDKKRDKMVKDEQSNANVNISVAANGSLQDEREEEDFTRKTNAADVITVEQQIVEPITTNADQNEDVEMVEETE